MCIYIYLECINALAYMYKRFSLLLGDGEPSKSLDVLCKLRERDIIVEVNDYSLFFWLIEKNIYLMLIIYLYLLITGPNSIGLASPSHHMQCKFIISCLLSFFKIFLFIFSKIILKIVILDIYMNIERISLYMTGQLRCD